MATSIDRRLARAARLGIAALILCAAIAALMLRLNYMNPPRPVPIAGCQSAIATATIVSPAEVLRTSSRNGTPIFRRLSPQRDGPVELLGVYYGDRSSDGQTLLLGHLQDGEQGLLERGGLELESIKNFAPESPCGQEVARLHAAFNLPRTDQPLAGHVTQAPPTVAPKASETVTDVFLCIQVSPSYLRDLAFNENFTEAIKTIQDVLKDQDGGSRRVRVFAFAERTVELTVQTKAIDGKLLTEPYVLNALDFAELKPADFQSSLQELLHGDNFSLPALSPQAVQVHGGDATHFTNLANYLRSGPPASGRDIAVIILSDGHETANDKDCMEATEDNPFHSIVPAPGQAGMPRPFKALLVATSPRSGCDDKVKSMRKWWSEGGVPMVELAGFGPDPSTPKLKQALYRQLLPVTPPTESDYGAFFNETNIILDKRWPGKDRWIPALTTIKIGSIKVCPDKACGDPVFLGRTDPVLPPILEAGFEASLEAKYPDVALSDESARRVADWFDKGRHHTWRSVIQLIFRLSALPTPRPTCR